MAVPLNAAPVPVIPKLILAVVPSTPVGVRLKLQAKAPAWVEVPEHVVAPDGLIEVVTVPESVPVNVLLYVPAYEPSDSTIGTSGLKAGRPRVLNRALRPVRFRSALVPPVTGVSMNP